MFGHDHEDKKDDNTQPMSTQPVSHGLLGIDDDNDAPASASPAPEPSSSPLPEPTQTSNSFASDSTTPTPTSSNDVSVTPPVPVDDTSSPDSVPSSETLPVEPPLPASSDDLVDIKRQALQELSPLIDHLDQNSEEKFKTTMMMIQASDDKDLIPQAFKAAKEITDEKKRAQALLDIVNEINYFTHKTEE